MTSLHGQQAAVLELEDSINWFHAKYGSDLPAFFRDALGKQGRPTSATLSKPLAATAGAGRSRVVATAFKDKS